MAKKAAKKTTHDYYDEEGEAPEAEPAPKAEADDYFSFKKDVPEYADDVDAAEKGLPVNGLYRTGSVLKVRVC